MTLSQILILGAAPTPVQNATLPQARAMAAHLKDFALVISQVVCTTEKGPAMSALVPVETITPAIPDDAELNFHLLLQAPGRDIPFSVAIWHGTVSRWGPRKATAWVLDVINPAWREDTSLVAKVDELADVAPLPVVILPPPLQLPPAPAMPNFYRPIGDGWFAAFPGDTSPAGSKFDAPDGSTWVKRVEESMFNTQKSGNVRWERQADANALMN